MHILMPKICEFCTLKNLSAYDPLAIFQGQKNAEETESHSSVRFVDLNGDLMTSIGEDSVGNNKLSVSGSLIDISEYAGLFLSRCLIC